jgi:hypothetical protein
MSSTYEEPGADGWPEAPGPSDVPTEDEDRTEDGAPAREDTDEERA